MPSDQPLFRGAYSSQNDETSGQGKRPVIFDILGPDRETSVLPEGLKMVLHVNPRTMSISYERKVERIQTRGGYVEQHWGDGSQTINFNMATGGFMRLYTGLSNITSTNYGGGRRETLAYDKYLDMLALFHNNGSIFDSRGNIVFQGIIKCTFDGGVWTGWFQNFTVADSSEKPFMFEMSTTFEVHQELQTWRSTLLPDSLASRGSSPEPEQGQANFSLFPGDS